MNDTVVAILIAVILGCIGIINTIVVTKLKVDEEVMWAKFRFAHDKYLKDNDAVVVKKSTLREWREKKKVEIAREIFEEIENNYADFLYDGYRNIVVLTEKDFAELKKKYESEGEG